MTSASLQHGWTTWNVAAAVLELPESRMMSEGQKPDTLTAQTMAKIKKSARPWVKLLDESPVSNND